MFKSSNILSQPQSKWQHHEHLKWNEYQSFMFLFRLRFRYGYLYISSDIADQTASACPSLPSVQNIRKLDHCGAMCTCLHYTTRWIRNVTIIVIIVGTLYFIDFSNQNWYSNCKRVISSCASDHKTSSTDHIVYQWLRIYHPLDSTAMPRMSSILPVTGFREILFPNIAANSS